MLGPGHRRLAAPPHFSLAPFIGAALGMLGWYEAVTPLFLTAAALMGLGLWLHLTEHHEHGTRMRRSSTATRTCMTSTTSTRTALTTLPGEPHTHWHRHALVRHAHPRYPDIHHRHSHR